MKRRELQERLRVMDERIAENETEKQRINRQVSDQKSKAAKEELELSSAEQKTNNGNDAKLTSAISSSIQDKQRLDGQEASELGTLQNTLGKTLSSLIQTLATLGQAESRDLNNALKTQQVSFVQGRLQKAWVATAQIQGIGAAYKSRLQAAGFYTANDIDYRVDRVKGIGIQRAASLRMWRNALEIDAKNRMPATLTWQEENSIKLRYATQKATLESQIIQTQQELKTREISIRTRYKGLKHPHEVVLLLERQKHESERTRISLEFQQRRHATGAKVREIEEDAVRAIVRLDSKQNEIRKEMFNLQWRMAKVEREVARFSRVSFGSYVRRVLVFS